MDDDAEDVALLARVSGGDEAALRQLYERHAPWLRMRLCRRSADEDLVAEVLSDTFVVVWRRADSFRGDGQVAAWLWGIAIRRLISRLRGHREPRPADAELIAAATTAVRSAEEEALIAIAHGDLGTALRSLSPELQSIVQATLVDGLSTREAARLLGIPQGTVKTRIRTARRLLREQLITANRSFS